MCHSNCCFCFDSKDVLAAPAGSTAWPTAGRSRHSGGCLLLRRRCRGLRRWLNRDGRFHRHILRRRRGRGRRCRLSRLRVAAAALATTVAAELRSAAATATYCVRAMEVKCSQGGVSQSRSLYLASLPLLQLAYRSCDRNRTHSHDLHCS